MAFESRRMLQNIRRAIFSKTISGIRTEDKRIGVYISGGMDSTIILGNLIEVVRAFNINLTAFSMDFGITRNECEDQTNIAKYYGVDFIKVEMKNLYEKLPHILSFFSRPQFNVWPYFLADEASKYDITNVFIGEGADEVFGGYHHKGYLEAWADSLQYIQRAYHETHEPFGIKVTIPFVDLNWRKLLNVHCSPYKYVLRKAYKNRLPASMVHKDSAPPFFTDYLAVWQREFYNHVKWIVPQTNEEALIALRIETARIWAEAQKQRYSLEEEIWPAVPWKSNI